KRRLLHAQLLDAGTLRYASGCAGAFSSRKTYRRTNCPGEVFWARGGSGCSRTSGEERGLSAFYCGYRNLGKTPRKDSSGGDCIAADGLAHTLAKRGTLPQ